MVVTIVKVARIDAVPIVARRLLLWLHSFKCTWNEGGKPPTDVLN